MSVNLFPLTQPLTAAANQGLPLCRDVAWDFTAGCPRIKNGEPVWCAGKEAVMSWAWRALKTPRFRREIYSWAYGSQVESLMGQPYSEDTKQAEARRYLREALLTNPYIQRVEDIQVEFTEGRLHLSARVVTIYGEEEVSADV